MLKNYNRNFYTDACRVKISLYICNHLVCTMVTSKINVHHLHLKGGVTNFMPAKKRSVKKAAPKKRKVAKKKPAAKKKAAPKKRKVAKKKK